jgi:hypothetical protein
MQPFLKESSHCEERQRLRGAAEANPEIPRAARNRLRNPLRLLRFARNDI